MPDPSQPPPVIIRKKRTAHGSHHGGAWKVAYADFVTAMMALFIVLWLMNANDAVKEAISVYFTDPTGAGKLTGTAAAGSGEGVMLTRDDMDKLKEKIEEAIKKMPEFDKIKDHVRMSVTGEGLRIEMSETERGVFFDSGSATPSAAGSEFIVLLAKELGKLPNHLLLEGHSDSKPFKDAAYTNWELSADRANAARRLMEGNGLGPRQILQVRGFADRQLRNTAKPEDASNRRISIIVKYLDQKNETPPASPKTAH
ncbi:MAG: OmpA family protein [Bryobacteraceae bacterium]|nr:OmpA family protein [Bryobacteraceae bacterium]